MLKIYRKGESSPIAKFEKFETGKAFDWITQKGYYIVHKEAVPYMFWVVEELPK